MKKVYVPVLDRAGVVSIYGNTFFSDLLQCLYYINAVRPSLCPGEMLYYKTLVLAE